MRCDEASTDVNTDACPGACADAVDPAPRAPLELSEARRACIFIQSDRQSLVIGAGIMDNPIPASAAFCHVFQHGGDWYAYNVGTNALLQIDPVLAAVLPLWGPLDEDEVVARLAGQYDDGAVRAAVAEIRDTRREEGLFRSDRPMAMAPCSDCHDQTAYASRLSHLTLSISEQCNLRCRYCLHGSSLPWIRSHGDKAMSRSTALAAVSYFARHSGDTDQPVISFYGGEPMLQRELVEAVICEAKSHPDWPDFRYVIDTNGTLLDDEAVAFLVAEGIHLQVSLDGPEAIHDRHRVTREGRGSHRKILAGLTRLVQHDRTAADRILFLATLAPPFDLEAVLEFFADFPPFRAAGITSSPQVRINFADLDGIDLGESDGGEDRTEPLPRQIAQARKRYLSACRDGQRDRLAPGLSSLFDQDLITFYHRSRDGLPTKLTPLGCCLPGQRRLHVRADGTFQPCERVGDSLVIGDVQRGIDLPATERLFESMVAAAGDRCRDCWAVRLCNICFTVLAPSWWEDPDGPAAPIPPARCADVRRQKETTMCLYLDLLAGDPEGLDWLTESEIT